MWFQHLKTVQENRKRGALKAAKTRKQKGLDKKKEQSEYRGWLLNFQCSLKIILNFRYNLQNILLG